MKQCWFSGLGVSHSTISLSPSCIHYLNICDTQKMCLGRDPVNMWQRFFFSCSLPSIHLLWARANAILVKVAAESIICWYDHRFKDKIM